MVPPTRQAKGAGGGPPFPLRRAPLLLTDHPEEGGVAGQTRQCTLDKRTTSIAAPQCDCSLEPEFRYSATKCVPDECQYEPLPKQNPMTTSSPAIANSFTSRTGETVAALDRLGAAAQSPSLAQACSRRRRTTTPRNAPRGGVAVASSRTGGNAGTPADPSLRGRSPWSPRPAQVSAGPPKQRMLEKIKVVYPDMHVRTNPTPLPPDPRSCVTREHSPAADDVTKQLFRYGSPSSTRLQLCTAGRVHSAGVSSAFAPGGCCRESNPLGAHAEGDSVPAISPPPREVVRGCLRPPGSSDPGASRCGPPSVSELLSPESAGGESGSSSADALLHGAPNVTHVSTAKARAAATLLLQSQGPRGRQLIMCGSLCKSDFDSAASNLLQQACMPEPWTARQKMVSLARSLRRHWTRESALGYQQLSSRARRLQQLLGTPTAPWHRGDAGVRLRFVDLVSDLQNAAQARGLLTEPQRREVYLWCHQLCLAHARYWEGCRQGAPHQPPSAPPPCVEPTASSPWEESANADVSLPSREIPKPRAQLGASVFNRWSALDPDSLHHPLDCRASGEGKGRTRRERQPRGRALTPPRVVPPLRQAASPRRGDSRMGGSRSSAPNYGCRPSSIWPRRPTRREARRCARTSASQRQRRPNALCRQRPACWQRRQRVSAHHRAWSKVVRFAHRRRSRAWGGLLDLVRAAARRQRYAARQRPGYCQDAPRAQPEPGASCTRPRGSRTAAAPPRPPTAARPPDASGQRPAGPASLSTEPPAAAHPWSRSCSLWGPMHKVAALSRRQAQSRSFNTTAETAYQLNRLRVLVQWWERRWNPREFDVNVAASRFNAWCRSEGAALPSWARGRRRCRHRKPPSAPAVPLAGPLPHAPSEGGGRRSIGPPAPSPRPPPCTRNGRTLSWLLAAMRAACASELRAVGAVPPERLSPSWVIPAFAQCDNDEMVDQYGLPIRHSTWRLWRPGSKLNGYLIDYSLLWWLQHLRGEGRCQLVQDCVAQTILRWANGKCSLDVILTLTRHLSWCPGA